MRSGNLDKFSFWHAPKNTDLTKCCKFKCCKLRRLNHASPVPEREKLSRYGLKWSNPVNTPLDVELLLIRHGGYATIKGKTVGHGLFYHFRQAQSLIWPEDDHHRWSDLCLKTMCDERIVVIQGPRDCSKTRTLSKWALVDYWTAPEETLTIMTSTGLRELELRVWGDIKSLFQRALETYPNLPGNINQANHGIFTDKLDERGDLRDMRRGIICVPCLTGEGEWKGLENFVGIKQKRRRLIGDEMQFIPVMYVKTLDAFDKGDFKGGFLGNPIGGNGKALDKIAEPICGWSQQPEVTKTTSWRNKFGGVTVNLVGTDSPNFDTDAPKKYPYLIDQEDIDRVAERNGRESAQFWTLIKGIRKTGVDAYRVLTVDMCEHNGAFNTAIWGHGQRIKVYGIDAGYGGDPCEAMYLEFGEDVNGNMLMEFSEITTIPIDVTSNLTAEEQIAIKAKADCERLGVPDTNVYFEAGMRATLATKMARIMSADVNAVVAGGPATERSVTDDTFRVDPKTGEKKLVKCFEQYSKFITEMWFSVRELVEAGQARALPRDVAEEFALREWRWVPGPIGQRYELETKPEFKARNAGDSPNKADATSIAVEGARRLGFTIKNLKGHRQEREAEDQWLERELEKHRRFVKSSELAYRT